jgi:hypothetical protein
LPPLGDLTATGAAGGTVELLSEPAVPATPEFTLRMPGREVEDSGRGMVAASVSVAAAAAVGVGGAGFEGAVAEEDAVAESSGGTTNGVGDDVWRRDGGDGPDVARTGVGASVFAAGDEGNGADADADADEDVEMELGKGLGSEFMVATGRVRGAVLLFTFATAASASSASANACNARSCSLSSSSSSAVQLACPHTPQHVRHQTHNKKRMCVRERERERERVVVVVVVVVKEVKE